MTFTRKPDDSRPEDDKPETLKDFADSIKDPLRKELFLKSVKDLEFEKIGDEQVCKELPKLLKTIVPDIKRRSGSAEIRERIRVRIARTL